VTTPLAIECLRCGQQREETHPEPECPRCGYLGWARSEALNERTRRLLRERPLHARRLRRVA
jgi:ribosomal protein L37E